MKLFEYHAKPTGDRVERILKPYSKFVRKLTKKEIEAIADYKSNSYKVINRYCREGKDAEFFSFSRTKFKRKTASSVAKQLTEIFKKAPVTTEKTFVTRTVKISEFDLDIHGGTKEKLLAKTIPGTTYTDEGFLSTACTTERMLADSMKSINMMFEVPAGTKMIPAHILDKEMEDYENEFIFPRNTKITITDRILDEENEIYMVYGKIET